MKSIQGKMKFLRGEDNHVFCRFIETVPRLPTWFSRIHDEIPECATVTVTVSWEDEPDVCQPKLKLLERFIRRGAEVKLDNNVMNPHWIVTFRERSLKAHGKKDDPVEAVIRYEENRELKEKKRA